MAGTLPRLAFLAAVTVFPAQVIACEVSIQAGKELRGARLADLPDGIVTGVLDCAGDRYPAQFWTLAVDPARNHLGVRDNKLFDPVHTGALTRLVSAKVEDHVRVVVLERSETAALSLSAAPQKRNGFRRFVTFCDNIETADPLDCSIGTVRIKARATAEHLDNDGYPDVTLHEISYYDGESRLHVISFAAPYSPRPSGDLSRWIGVINAVSDVLQPEQTASIEP